MHNPFKSKKKTIVSASTYNGAALEYTPLLPTMLSSAVIGNEDLVESVFQNQLMKGRAITLPNYHNWCKKSGGLYDKIGHVTSTFYANTNLDYSRVASSISSNLQLSSNQTIGVSEASSGVFNIQEYGDWLIDNKYSAYVGTDYVVESVDVKEYSIYRWVRGDRVYDSETHMYHYEYVKQFVTTTLDPSPWQNNDDYAVEVSGYKLKCIIKDSEGTVIASEVVTEDTAKPWFSAKFTITTKVVTKIPATEKEPEKEEITYIKNDYYWYLSQAQANAKGLSYVFSTAVKPINRSIVSPIPLRRYNSWNTSGSVYQTCAKAYKKFTGSKYDDMIKNLKENISQGSISEIDHIFLVYGVPICSKKKSMQAYIWKFMENLHENWLLAGDKTNSSQTLSEWNAEGFAFSGTSYTGSFFKKRPNAMDIENSVWYRSNNDWCYDFTISWRSSFHTTISGKCKTNAKVGDFNFLTYDKAQSYTVTDTDSDGNDRSTSYTDVYEICEFRKQVTENSYEAYFFSNLLYKNNIYGGLGQSQSGQDGMWASEDDCEFLIPIEIETFKELSLVHRNQVANYCGSYVCNSYKTVKKKWFQRGIFGVITVIIGAVLCWFGQYWAGIPLIAAGLGQVAYTLIIKLLTTILSIFVGKNFAEKIVGVFVELVKIVCTIMAFVPNPYQFAFAMVAASINAAQAGNTIAQGELGKGLFQLGASMAGAYAAEVNLGAAANTGQMATSSSSVTLTADSTFDALASSNNMSLGSNLGSTTNSFASSSSSITLSTNAVADSVATGTSVTGTSSAGSIGAGTVSGATSTSVGGMLLANPVDSLLAMANSGISMAGLVNSYRVQNKLGQINTEMTALADKQARLMEEYSLELQELMSTNPVIRTYMFMDAVALSEMDFFAGAQATLVTPILMLEQGFDAEWQYITNYATNSLDVNSLFV